MRLFIAIDLPKQLCESLKEVQNKINNEHAKLRLVKSFHLTLKFLGEVNEQILDKISESLSKVNFSSFSLEKTELGVFPNKNHIIVIWVAINMFRNKNYGFRCQCSGVRKDRFQIRLTCHCYPEN